MVSRLLNSFLIFTNNTNSIYNAIFLSRLLQKFQLKTDTSVQGFGVVLSQAQCNGVAHTLAYASSALLTTEKKYAITKLKTLRAVWAVTHFHAYLYGNNVTKYTDHSPVLETFNPTCMLDTYWRQCCTINRCYNQTVV